MHSAAPLTTRNKPFAIPILRCKTEGLGPPFSFVGKPGFGNHRLTLPS